jgi:hypothetical protein
MKLLQIAEYLCNTNQPLYDVNTGNCTLRKISNDTYYESMNVIDKVHDYKHYNDVLSEVSVEHNVMFILFVNEAVKYANITRI